MAKYALRKNLDFPIKFLSEICSATRWCFSPDDEVKLNIEEGGRHRIPQILHSSRALIESGEFENIC
jgi:hypothetical protein